MRNNKPVIIIRNIPQEHVPAWREWGDLFCRMANFSHLTIDPLAKRPKNSGMIQFSMLIPPSYKVCDNLLNKNV